MLTLHNKHVCKIQNRYIKPMSYIESNETGARSIIYTGRGPNDIGILYRIIEIYVHIRRERERERIKSMHRQPQ